MGECFAERLAGRVFLINQKVCGSTLLLLLPENVPYSNFFISSHCHRWEFHQISYVLHEYQHFSLPCMQRENREACHPNCLGDSAHMP